MDCIDKIVGSGIRILCFVLFFFFVVGNVGVAEFAQTLSVVVDFVFLWTK